MQQHLSRLIERARDGMQNAYAPISDFAVGASVLTEDGSIFQGCNVESVISGMGVCAERCAIDNAVANGHYRFAAICVVSQLPHPIRPCGMCLQYIAEFAQVGKTDIVVYMVGKDGQLVQSPISNLLPNAFGPRDLGLDLSRFEGNAD